MCDLNVILMLLSWKSSLEVYFCVYLIMHERTLLQVVLCKVNPLEISSS